MLRRVLSLVSSAFIAVCGLVVLMALGAWQPSREQALEAAHAAGVRKKLCCLLMDEYGMAPGKEPMLRDGAPISYVTSANYGYSVGKYICYACLPVEHALPGTELSIEYFGKPQRAVVAVEPLFDPQMQRMKG